MWYSPAEQFYLFPRSLEADDLAFSERAKQFDLLIVPGTGFGAPGHVRISYCVQTEMIQRGLAEVQGIGGFLSVIGSSTPARCAGVLPSQYSLCEREGKGKAVGKLKKETSIFPLYKGRLFCYNSGALIRYASVVQLDRASDSGSECWGFESLRACHIVGKV